MLGSTLGPSACPLECALALCLPTTEARLYVERVTLSIRSSLTFRPAHCQKMQIAFHARLTANPRLSTASTSSASLVLLSTTTSASPASRLTLAWQTRWGSRLTQQPTVQKGSVKPDLPSQYRERCEGIPLTPAPTSATPHLLHIRSLQECVLGATAAGITHHAIHLECQGKCTIVGCCRAHTAKCGSSRADHAMQMRLP